MDQSTENTVKKCEIVVDAQNNTTNTLKSVRKKILSTISISRRKANENFDDQKEMNQDKSGDESFGKSKITIKKIFRKSSFRKFISNINFTNFTTNNAKNDRVPPITTTYTWPSDVTPGVIGLRNHGNTCFMNAVLQCLSHTDILAEYFVLDQYKADLRKRNKINSRKFGTKGELTEQLAQVLKALWTCKDASEYSTNFKEVVERYGAQFRSSTQHDAQEFLFWLLDKVHEDLNTATKRKYKNLKNNYGRPDDVLAAETLANYMRCNNSFVQAVFRAQFRSSLTCPRCHKQSNTFDPFHCISVQLPQLSLQPVNVNVLYDTKTPRQVKMSIGVPQGSSVMSLREKIHIETGIDEKRMVLTEATSTGFGRLFCDSHPASNVSKDETVLCIELPGKIEDSQIALCIMNVKVSNKDTASFGSILCMKINRDVSFSEFQKSLLKQMSSVLKPEVFSYSTSISDMFKIHLQEPSADPGTYLESKFEHPLLTEMIDLALSVQPSDSGPLHIKLSLEWTEPEKYFADMEDHFVEHESLTEQKNKTSEENVLTLEQCLDHYTKAETLSAENSWRCPHCQKYLPVVKTLGLWSLPDILVIHFKRFRQQQFKGSHASKLTTMVNFPLTGFDLSTWHLAEGSHESSSVHSTLTRKMKPSKTGTLTKLFFNEGDNRYDLYSVCYHQGDTLETGHYTAACKNPYDQHWYKFDDQRVSKINNDEVSEKIINNEAYMLFYQRRRNGEGSESSGASTSSTEHWVSKIAPAVVTKAVVKTTEESSEVKVAEDDSVKPEVEKEKSEELPELTAVLNIDDIQAIDSDDIPEVTSEHSDFEEAVEELETPETPEVAPEVNKITIQVEITRSSPAPEIENSPIHLKDKNSNDVGVEESMKRSEESDKIEELMSRRTINDLLWNDANNNNNRHSDVGAITISDLLSMERIDEISSSSLPKNYMLQECEPITKRLRGVSSCSKDTLLYIDQQGLLEDESLLENRAHWISPVTPHKLISVSPKN